MTAPGPLSQALLDLAPDSPDLVALSADVVKYTDLAAFAERYPDRVVNVGMAEQNLVAVAVGLSKAGYVPFATTFGVFATRRALDFIEIQVALGQANVKVCGGLPGIMSTFGPTHQAIDDLAYMRVIPGLTVLDPCDAVEMRAAATAAYHHDGPVYLRLLLSKEPPLPGPRAPFRIGPAAELVTGGDVGIVASSFMVGRALEAASRLRSAGVQRGRAEDQHPPAVRLGRGGRIRRGRAGAGHRRESLRRRRPGIERLRGSRPRGAGQAAARRRRAGGVGGHGELRLRGRAPRPDRGRDRRRGRAGDASRGQGGSVVTARLDHIGVVVSDMDRALDFWSGLIGLEVTGRGRADWPHLSELNGLDGVELEWCTLALGSGVIELTSYAGRQAAQARRSAEDEPGRAHVGLVVDDLAHVAGRLGSAGAKLRSDGPVLLMAGQYAGWRALYALDPDGTSVELFERPAGPAHPTGPAGAAAEGNGHD